MMAIPLLAGSPNQRFMTELYLYLLAAQVTR